MALGDSTFDTHADNRLEAAIEVLEALECLLYLMDEGAATPQLVKAYVCGAKKVLCAPPACLLQ
jgi:hypothetical protein